MESSTNLNNGLISEIYSIFQKIDPETCLFSAQKQDQFFIIQNSLIQILKKNEDLITQLFIYTPAHNDKNNQSILVKLNILEWKSVAKQSIQFIYSVQILPKGIDKISVTKHFFQLLRKSNNQQTDIILLDFSHNVHITNMNRAYLENNHNEQSELKQFFDESLDSNQTFSFLNEMNIMAHKDQYDQSLVIETIQYIEENKPDSLQKDYWVYAQWLQQQEILDFILARKKTEQTLENEFVKSWVIKSIPKHSIYLQQRFYLIQQEYYLLQQAWEIGKMHTEKQHGKASFEMLKHNQSLIIYQTQLKMATQLQTSFYEIWDVLKSMQGISEKVRVGFSFRLNQAKKMLQLDMTDIFNQ